MEIIYKQENTKITYRHYCEDSVISSSFDMIRIEFENKNKARQFLEYFKIKGNIFDTTVEDRVIVELKDSNCSELILQLYEGSEKDHNYCCNCQLYKMYKQISNGVIKWYKKIPEAVTPFKNRVSDVGWDLTLIKIHLKVSNKITLYETGISVTPPSGFYISVYPRSSLGLTGYVLSNSKGIIDPSYTGTIKVCLTKVDESFPDLKLPFKAVQMILEPLFYSGLRLEDKQEETTRGDKGFGSST